MDYLIGELPPDENLTRPYDLNTKCCTCSNGMAGYSIHLLLASLHIEDTPISYNSSRGPSTDFKVVYNQREANPPATFFYSNFGSKWTFNWLSYVTDDGAAAPSVNPRVNVRGGGSEVYFGFNSNSGTYIPNPQTHAVLVRTSDSSYEKRFPDGSKEVFDKIAGSNPRRLFLSQVVDPTGANTVTLSYDEGTGRIRTITDSLGQSMTLSYELLEDDLKITKVEDPFHRIARFDYESGRLTRITDPAQIESSFEYEGADFIKTLITPYGSTRFWTDEVGNGLRWIKATDPMGDTELVEYRDSSSIPASETVAPSGAHNSNLQYQNTFYWDKKAMAEAPGDYSKARIFHWLSTSDGKVSGILASEKAPLENRVWYTYADQADPEQAGPSAEPIQKAQVMSDGSTAFHQFTYNSLGLTTKMIDPIGRVTTYLYDGNQIDLLKIFQRRPGGASADTEQQNADLVTEMTYDPAEPPHRAKIVKDAAGQPTTYHYNAQGQVLWMRNAKDGTTTYGYGDGTSGKPLGYLTSITSPPVNGVSAMVTYVYDTANRVRTVTQVSDGNYAVTTDYDNLDRPTMVTFPDNTHQEFHYTRYDASHQDTGIQTLDLTASRDRRGLWTYRDYDALRRMTAITDPENRVTHYDWCSCGALGSITDAENHMTTFLRDLQGRLIRKQYFDNSGMNYLYEGQTAPNTVGATSRIASMTDAKGQRTNYSYFNDDTVAQMRYTDTAGAPLYPVTPTVTCAYDPNYNRITSMSDGTGSAIYSYHPVTLAGTLGANQLKDVDGPLPDDTITYGYDQLGRTLSQSINGVASSVTYDALGRMSASDNDVLGHFTRTYQGATGRPLSVVAAQNGQITNYHYLSGTADRRLDYMQNLKAGGVNLSRFDYTYDPEGEIMSWSKTLGTNAATALWFGYDNAQQLKVARNTANSNISTYENAFAYDLAGNRTSDAVFNPQLQFPNGTGHTYTPNSLNQLTNVSLLVNGTPVETEPLLYDLNGNMTAGATNQTYEWDAANRLVAINYLSTGKRSEFAYDGGNRRVKIVEKGAGQTAVAQPGGVAYIDYASAPITAAAGNYTISFEGLDAGPQNAVLIDAVTLNDAPVANGSFETPVLTGSEYERSNPTGATWTFEGNAGVARSGSTLTNGNPASPAGAQVGFVKSNNGVIRQTVTLTTGSYTLAFKAAQSGGNKAPQQVRVTFEKTGLPTSVQRFVFSGNTIAEERDSTGATVMKRFFAEGEWRLNSKGDGKYYYTRDHLGSIREVTNSSGVLQARYDYDLWGNSVVVNGTMSLDFGFTGQYVHAPSGLILFLYRPYNAPLGRWGSRDPIGEMGGLNLYGYTFNNPVNWVDPFGLDIRIESTDQVGGLHRRVSVDTPSGPYGQSFGMINGNAPFQPSSAASGAQPGNGTPGSGIVYPDSDPTRRVILTFPTTPAEDALALDLLRQELNQTGPYNPLTRSCRDYSHERYDRIKEEISRRRRQQLWNDFKSWLGF